MIMEKERMGAQEKDVERREKEREERDILRRV
jgi:hypothetical protein